MFINQQHVNGCIFSRPVVVRDSPQIDHTNFQLKVNASGNNGKHEGKNRGIILK